MDVCTDAGPNLTIPEEVIFNVNKPFIFIIENGSTGCELFSGIIKAL
ncbi:MAG: hypothetical protein K2H18_02750 [Muribaculaceae bacterium]|nr:hypothetical protein [Muribaculaceae bacterium]